MDARTASTFLISANQGWNIHGIRGAGIPGQIVTIMMVNRGTFHHAEAGVITEERFNGISARDILTIAPSAFQFIWVNREVGWYRLI